HDAARSITEQGPAVRFAKHPAAGEHAGAQFLVVPKHIALRVALLREQPVHQADGLHRFAVKHRFYGDARFLFKILENRLRKFFILRGVNHDGGCFGADGVNEQEAPGCSQSDDQRNHCQTTKPEDFVGIQIVETPACVQGHFEVWSPGFSRWRCRMVEDVENFQIHRACERIAAWRRDSVPCMDAVGDLITRSSDGNTTTQSPARAARSPRSSATITCWSAAIWWPPPWCRSTAPTPRAV